MTSQKPSIKLLLNVLGICSNGISTILVALFLGTPRRARSPGRQRNTWKPGKRQPEKKMQVMTYPFRFV